MNAPDDQLVSPTSDGVNSAAPAGSTAGAGAAKTGFSGNPFACNVCNRSYTRVDHLARHYRSHTREKPFTCPVCGKNFARVDLLKRHTTSHKEETANKRQEKATHSRVSQACIACAETKLRCEGSNPCGRCLNKGILCEYAQSRNRKSTNLTQVQSNASGSGNGPNTSQLGNGAQTTSALPSNQHTGGMNSQFNHDPMLGMGNEQYGTDQSGMSMNNGDQTMLDSAQLPTPTTFDQGSTIIPLEPSYYDPNPTMTFDDLPLIDFLRDVMTPTPVHRSTRNHGTDGMQFFPKDVLDFNIDSSMDFMNAYALPNMFSNDNQNLSYPISRPEGVDDPSANRSGFTTPGIRRSISLGTQAFKESIWLWTPAKEDHGFAEQHNLSLPYGSVSSDNTAVDAIFSAEQLSSAARDGILAMVLSTCESAIYPRVVACFPSSELLTDLFHSFMCFHMRQEVSWIHPATLNINEDAPEFVGALICSGAVLSRVPELRKLGFAIQEALRLYIANQFENDNRNTRRLRLLQAFSLHLNVGLWSGDRRKMEIAESFALPLLTMVRRAGHFRRPRHSETTPLAGDDARTIETKWQTWVEAESFKRLALTLFSHDTWTSMSLLNQPLISYTELSAELPYSKDLWLAKTATEWKTIYLSRIAETDDRLPSIRICVDDTSPIFKYQHIVDVQMTLIVIISSIWRLIWQYREMTTTVKSHGKGDLRNIGPTANSLHQEISHLMQHLSLNATEWDGGMKPPARLLHEQCLMHLRVSLEEVQLLAGKEGEDEARKAFPVLSAWAESTESRHAIFHAGQVLRAAKQLTGYMLRDAFAIAVYHASLTFWAYSVLSKTINNPDDPQQQGNLSQRKYVRLDGEDGPELQRFLVLGKGMPSIRRWVEGDEMNPELDVPLSDPMSVMNAITSLLWKKNGDDERRCPPLVVNLSKLMSSLGNAAAGMRRR